MTMPVFDEKGYDRTTFEPFCLHNCLSTQWQDVRLSFSNWAWLDRQYGTDTIDDYYLNGYGIQSLVQAALYAANIELDEEETNFNSEGDTCNIQFKNMDAAVSAAKEAARMIADREQIQKMIAIARAQGFED